MRPVGLLFNVNYDARNHELKTLNVRYSEDGKVVEAYKKVRIVYFCEIMNERINERIMNEL